MTRKLKSATSRLVDAAVAFAHSTPGEPSFVSAYQALEDAVATYEGLLDAGPAPAAGPDLTPIRRKSHRWNIVTVLAEQRTFAPAKIGGTKDELGKVLGLPHQTVSAAINALVQGGWLADSGYHRGGNARFPQAVWYLTNAGYDRYVQMLEEAE